MSLYRFILPLILLFVVGFAGLKQEELVQLANQKFKVNYFFFNAKNLGQAFVMTENENGDTKLYRFNSDGSWEPVSNAKGYGRYESAPQYFDTLYFDPATKEVNIGNLVADAKVPDAKVADAKKIELSPDKKIAQTDSSGDNPQANSPKTVDPKKRISVVMKTTQGDIQLQLFNDIAPKTVENFLYLSEKGLYNDLIFHRIIKGFMIQGGDPKGDGTGGMSKWGKYFEDEFHQAVNFDRPYLLAMANSGANSNGSQFFITVLKTPWLNQKHTIFGEVTKGKKVVDKLSKVKTGEQDRPIKEQRIISIKVLK